MSAITAACGQIGVALEGKIRRYLSHDTNADRHGSWLRKLPPLGSGAPLIPLVGASGSDAGRAFFPLRPTPRPLT